MCRTELSQYQWISDTKDTCQVRWAKFFSVPGTTSCPGNSWKPTTVLKRHLSVFYFQERFLIWFRFCPAVNVWSYPHSFIFSMFVFLSLSVKARHFYVSVLLWTVRHRVPNATVKLLIISDCLEALVISNAACVVNTELVWDRFDKLKFPADSSWTLCDFVLLIMS